MTRRATVALVVVLLAATAGCQGVLSQAEQPGSAADVQLSSVGQSPVSDGTAVEISGTATNHGDTSTTVTVNVAVLNESSVIEERSVSLGELGADESASFSMTFDVDPDRVDGRRITFD